MDVGGDYGIGSLFRRNSYVGALNTRAPYLVSSAINQSGNIERAKVTRPMFNILEHYANVVLMLETILQFYRPL